MTSKPADACFAQAERLGASIVKTLRVHAETLRVKRLQRAEELAHMAIIAARDISRELGFVESTPSARKPAGELVT